MDANLIASSGTLAAATLESAGYYYQSVVLDALAEPFSHSAGALLYLVGLLAIITQFVISGQIKHAHWVLVAPGLFFSLVFIRTPTEGAGWKFGGEERNEERLMFEIEQAVRKASNGTIIAGEYEANISSFFARYNEVISSVTQEFVRVINRDRKKADVFFIVRDQLYTAMDFPMVTDRGLSELIHAGLFANCAPLIQHALRMMDGFYPACDRCQAARAYKAMLQQHYPLPPLATDYVAGLLADNPTLEPSSGSSNPISETCVTDPIIATCGEDPNTCPPAYSFLFTDAQISACRFTDINIGELFDTWCAPVASRGGSFTDIAQWTTSDIESNGVSNTAMQGFLDSKAKVQGKAYTCPEIWTFAHAGLHRHALETYSAAMNAWNYGIMNIAFEGICGITLSASVTEDIFGGYAAWVGFSNPREVINQIARRMFRREVEKGSVSAMAAHYWYQHSAVNLLGIPNEDEMSLSGRSKVANRSWSERTKLMIAATSLPYYQGLGLFFLGVAFPFFALLLLIPGKHAGFLSWFALWAWIKSWDVAFAVVMLLSDTLYSMFVANVTEMLPIFGKGLSADLAIAIYDLKTHDPTYNLALYFNIISVALLSIPYITGQLFLSSFRGGAGILASGAQLYNVSKMSNARPPAWKQNLVNHELDKQQKAQQEAEQLAQQQAGQQALPQSPQQAAPPSLGNPLTSPQAANDPAAEPPPTAPYPPRR